MKHNYLIIALMMAILSVPALSKEHISDEQIKQKLLESHAMNSSAQGRLFYIAIAPDYQAGYPGILDFYVTSSYDTRVCVEQVAMGFSMCKEVRKDQITTFTNLRNETSWGWEVWTSQQPEDKGIKLTADKPISLYVLEAKAFTSEGYIGIPVAAWGKKYVHMSYYDFGFSAGFPLGGGFVVVAAEDQTRITCRLRGEGGNSSTTDKGTRLGQTLTATLNEGQVYMVKGAANTTNSWDLTGTEVTANKNVGMISFHMCPWIPAATCCCDNLLAAMPPVETWGKKYATVELDRGRDKGDFFRVVAAENNTKANVKWYELGSAKLIGDRNIELNTGEFFEYLNVEPGPTTESIRGMSVWEADKPILVMQYSYSAGFDNARIPLDPFMFTVTPVEQFTKRTVFQTPENAVSTNSFTINFFNIVALGDTTGFAETGNYSPNHYELMNSVRIDGQRVVDRDPAFALNRIPNTNVFWGRMNVTIGPHRVQGNTPFGGYVYGYATYDSYGWPAATNYGVIGETDTLPPVLTSQDLGCGVFNVRSTELRNGPIEDNPRQVDRGIEFLPEILETSYNFLPPVALDEFDQPRVFSGFPTEYNVKWRFEVADKTKDAFIEYVFFDASENQNFSRDSLIYYADKILTDKLIIDFPNTRVDVASAPIPLTITSDVDRAITITKVSLEKNLEFKIVAGQLPPNGIVLQNKGDSHTLQVVYTPTREYQTLLDKMDIDSLVIETTCAETKIPINGRGVEPLIWVDDFNAGNLQVGERICKNNGIEIRNPGSMPLEIRGIRSIKDADGTVLLGAFTTNIGDINTSIGGNFEVNNPTAPAFPFTVEPGATVRLNNVCFTPQTNGVFRYAVEFEHTAKPGNQKDVSDWRGSASLANVEITSIFWNTKRVNSVNRNNSLERDEDGTMVPTTGYIEIENDGSANVDIVTLVINNQSGDFAIDETKPVQRNGADLVQPGIVADLMNPARTLPLNAGDVLRVPFVFSPATEKNPFEEEIALTFRDQIGEATEIVATIGGESFLPAIEATGFEFTPRVLLEQEHPVTGKVTIVNTSTKSDLRIFNVELQNNTINVPGQGVMTQFVPENWPNFNNPVILGVGGQLVLDVKFTPYVVGEHVANVIITSDEGPAEDGAAEDAIPQRQRTVTLTGEGYNIGSNVTGHAFGTHMLCESPEATITITNESDSDELIINAAQWVTNPGGAFVIVNGYQDNMVIPANGTADITIRFNPVANGNVAVDGLLRFTPNVGEPLDAVVSGTGRSESITISLPRIDNAQIPGSYMPGRGTAGKQNDPYQIRIEGTDWPNAQVSEITFAIEYDPRWFLPEAGANPIIQGDGYAIQNPNNWVATQVVRASVMNQGMNELVINIRSNNGETINRNGILCNPQFLLLLGPSLTINPQIVASSINVGARSVCVATNKVDNPIRLFTCLSENRIIEASNTSYSFAPVVVMNNSAEINYSIGLEGETTVELVNSKGEVVAMPVSGNAKPGVYSTSINLENYGSGAYFVRLSSGPFVDSQKLMIVK